MRLAKSIPGHSVVHTLELGWDALLDGPLLDNSEGEFDVIVTLDRSLRFQQRLKGRSFAVILLRAKRNTVGALLKLAPDLLAAIDELKPGEFREIGAP